jgi:hypothetical protein
MVDFVFDDRDRKIAEIIKGVLQSVILFRSLYENQKNNTLTFSDLQKLIDDKGDSILFSLKTKCHNLFRNDKVQKSIEKEKLFDLAIGSIFHGAMRLREDLYQLEVYGPLYDDLEGKSEKTDYEKQFLNQFTNIIRRARQSLHEEFEETRILFEDTINQLEDLLPEYAKNGLVIRFLLKNESLVNNACGEDTLDNLCRLMFKTGYTGALCVAAMSYAMGGFNEKAENMLKQAERSKENNEYVKYASHYCVGMHCHYNRNYDEALKNLNSAKSMAKKFQNEEHSIKMIEHFCDKINSVIEKQKT